MAAIDEMECSNSYEDFEPLCKWQRHGDFDILELHLPGFKIEELKVQINSNDILIITGEHVTDNNVKSRFIKEIKVSKKFDKQKIHAKFVKAGILYVTLPKKTTSLASNQLVGDLRGSSFMMKFKISRKWVVQFMGLFLAAAFGFVVCKYFFCRHARS